MIFELEAKHIVDLLQKEEGHPNCIGAVISNCKIELREIPMFQIQHCYCEANKCVDALVRWGALPSQDFVVLLEPPVDVSLLLSLDSTGVSYERFVPLCNSVP